MSSKLKIEMSANPDNLIRDVGKAKKSVDEFGKKTEGVSKELDKLEKESNKATNGVNNLSNAERRAAIDALKHSKAIKNASKELKNMESAAKSASSSLSSALSSLGSGDFLGFAGNVKNAGMAFKGLIPAATSGVGAVGGLTAAFGTLGTAITTALGPIGLIAAGIAAVGVVSYKGIKASEEFKSSLAGFSALTGMTGSALEDMGERARELGLKYGKAATDIVESMKMIGSQAPQLLKDADAMEEVTDAAIVLSKASGITVADAAKGLTTVMNQLGVSASEAKEIINALAAGSKEGAADVAYLQAAIEKSGTIAKSAGLSYQQLIGVIETLAPSFSSADVAGTALKGTLLKLTTQSNNEFNPAIVGIEKALDNLSKANLSASDMVKMFGESNVTAATLLIKNRKELANMTNAVTGTNTAFEQMNVQSGFIIQEWEKLKVAVQDVWIEFGNSEIMKGVAGLFILIIKYIELSVAWNKQLIRMWNTILEVIEAVCIKLYNEVIKPTFDYIKNTITDSKAFKVLEKLWLNIRNVIVNVIKEITNLWNKFMKWLGIDKGTIKVEGKVKASIQGESVEDAPSLNLSNGNSPKGNKSPKETISDLQKAEITYAKELQSLQFKLNNGIITQKEYETDLLNIYKRLLEVKIDNNEATEEDVRKYKELKDTVDKRLSSEELLKEAQKEAEKNLQKYNQELQKTADLEKKLKDDVSEALSPRRVSIGESVEKKYHNTGVTSSSSKSGIELQDAISKYDALKKKIEDAKNNKIISDESIKEAEKGLDTLSLKIDELAKKTNMENMFGNVETALSGLYEVGDYIRNIGDTFENCETGLDYFLNGLNAVIEAMRIFNTVMTTINTIQAIFNSVSAASAVATTTAATAALEKTAADTASIGPAIASTAANKALEASYLEMASAAIFAAHAMIPFVGVAIASGQISAMMGAMAAATATSKTLAAFKDGGIVSGSTTVGDSVLTRLNKGEMVLNTRQQANLFRLLNGGFVTSNSSNIGDVTFKIKGSDLIGTINNYNKKHLR